MGKYDTDLYVQRNLEKKFQEFMDSDKTGIAVVGLSGAGKTNLFCHLARKYSARGDLVLLYNGAFLSKADIENRIATDLNAYSLGNVADLALRESRHFIIFVDGVNDHGYPDIDAARILLSNINDIIEKNTIPSLKVAISCRSVVWNRIFDYNRLHLYRSRFFHLEEGPEISLSFFDSNELRAAYQQYRKRFRLLTEFTDLSDETHQMLSDPLMLSLVSETYAEKPIPSRTALYDVFDRYYAMKILEDIEKGTGWNLRDFLDNLVKEMRSMKVDRLELQYLQTLPFFKRHIEDSRTTSAFTRLTDENILYIIPPRNEVKFTYDRFLEYMLSKMILSERLDSNAYSKLISESESFWSMRGAVAMVLIVQKNWHVIRSYALSDDYLGRSVITEVLVGLITENREETVPFLWDLYNSGSAAAERLVVLVVARVRPVISDLLEQAMKNENFIVRRLAVQMAYLIWVRNHDEGAQLAKHIATIGLRDLGRPIMEASLELQERIFLNNYKDRDAFVLVDSLGLQRVAAAISVAERMRILDAGILLTERMYTKLWGWSYDEWVHPVFSASDEDRDGAKRMLQYLNPYSKMSTDDLKTLYDLAAGPFAGIVSLVLIFQMRRNSNDVLPLIRELMGASNESRILRGLGGLASASRWIDVPESDLETARRLIFHNKLCRDAVLEFGLNMSLRSFGRMDFIESILTEAMKENNDDVLKDTINQLGSVGIRFPEIVFSTLQIVIKTRNKSVEDELAKAFARMRVFHPDLVDNYLWNQRRDLMGRVNTSMELEHVPIEIFRVIEFVEYLFEILPGMLRIFVQMLERFIDMKSDTDFRKMLAFCITTSVRTWFKRESTEEYLRHIESDARE